MLIRSQDKKTIVPMEHGYVTISDRNKKASIIYAVLNEDDAYITLGNYSTDEKAIKVLDMMQQTYINSLGELTEALKNQSY